MKLSKIDSIRPKIKGKKEGGEEKVYLKFEAKQFGGSCCVVSFPKSRQTVAGHVLREVI